ncbi:MAG: DapH/DapD/GlmU-related protein [Balneolales bacterium]
MSLARLIAAAWIGWLYNDLISHLPSRRLRWLVLRPWLSSVGQGAGVQMHCRILRGPGITLGDRSVINQGCLLDGRRHPIHIGRDVSIGPEAAILTLGHDPQSAEFADRGGPVVVGDRAWIGYRAIVLPGITIGEGAVVGAGAVVSRDVAPFTIVAGNPASPIGKRSSVLTYELKYRPFLL